MSIEIYDQPAPRGYVDIDTAAEAAKRSRRTIYDWIRLENIRTFKSSNAPMLVHLDDIMKIDALRLKGRRRKPRLPRL